ncbi:MAG: GNAT family N-acetyltransferase [Candidatus Sphingomonas colombiensis]|nr:GNAT family N-acetyltransferase [Sphingomonas sp.]WEK43004.1 MAG: GNAT family N-acetyltransferase [Sphingomonas sp.]
MQTPITRLTTRSGVQLDIRLAKPGDEFAIDQFFDQLSPEDRRFRFLATASRVGRALIETMTRQDGRDATYLVSDTESVAMIALAMLCFDSSGQRAEVAIAVRSDRKDQGIGWELMRFAMDQARTHGVQWVEAIESRDNIAAVDLERELGLTVEPLEGEPTLVKVSRKLTAAG